MKKFTKFLLLIPLTLGRLKAQPSRHLPLGAAEFCNVGEGTREDGKKSFASDVATTSRYLFYEMSAVTNDNVTLALGTNMPLGVSDDLADAAALDIPISVKLLGAFRGTSRAISDGSVTNNTLICVSKAGNGYAICPAGGAGTFWVVGRALVGTDNDSGGPVVAGDTFEFIPVFPVQKTY